MNRVIGTIVAALTVLAVVGGCGDDSEEASVTEKQITNADAYRLDIAYLQQTVNGLSWNAVLTDELPGKPNSKRYPTPVPCNDDDSDPEQPYQWGRAMWLLLPHSMSNTVALDEVSRLWDSFGWQKTDGDPDRYEVQTPDAFVLVALTNLTDEISIKVGSPCFPKSQLDRTLVWPETITKEDATD